MASDNNAVNRPILKTNENTFLPTKTKLEKELPKTVKQRSSLKTTNSYESLEIRT